MPRLFLKPKLEPKEYLSNLEKDIFALEKLLGEMREKYREDSVVFLTEFSSLKERKNKEIDELESILCIKRSELDQLNKPFIDKSAVLDAREKELDTREQDLFEKEQAALKAKREAEQKMEDIQDLSDKLGETQIRQESKQKLLIGRENGLKDRETAHMAKVERFSHEVNEAAARIQERENDLLIRELSVEGKEENLIEREKELKKGWGLLHDREGVLKRSWDELKQKQHGITKRA